MIQNDRKILVCFCDSSIAILLHTICTYFCQESMDIAVGLILNIRNFGYGVPSMADGRFSAAITLFLLSPLFISRLHLLCPWLHSLLLKLLIHFRDEGKTKNKIPSHVPKMATSVIFLDIDIDVSRQCFVTDYPIFVPW
nr:hypothetical protein Iba_chr09dCG2920 [Ipomoea batatas]